MAQCIYNQVYTIECRDEKCEGFYDIVQRHFIRQFGETGEEPLRYAVVNIANGKLTVEATVMNEKNCKQYPDINDE